MSSSTELFLPHTLAYPVKIVSIDIAKSADIKRGTRLLSYSFGESETRFGTWDSPVEGVLDVWKVKVGDRISSKWARERAAVLVIEPCKHGVQIGGLCGLCGKDMTGFDYTGFSDSARASIQMTHSAFGPTVSLEEAQRIERETAAHLLKARKLSLIVDLDQTVVHATVDPTVGDWIAEGQAWEEREARRLSKAQKAQSKSITQDDDASDDESSDSDETDSDPEEECNPNWEALKDVKQFKLKAETFGPQPRGAKGKQKLLENDGCTYYIKPRPGWQEFFSEMSQKYEMHVYTMGTRAYAEEVCAAIDPGGRIFGGRILSRDESGSLTQKSLQRLFPCDTSMVVIIDDRADVWEWSSNLIKVIPYDFFIGIGDINSSFLPKVEPLTTAVAVQPPSNNSDKTSILPSQQPGLASPSESSGSPSDASTDGDVTPATTPPPPSELSSDQDAAAAMLTQNSLALEAQLEHRPLAKAQEELQESSVEPKASYTVDTVSSTTSESSKPESNQRSTTPPPKADKPSRKALLKNDDFELHRIRDLLQEVHSRFFDSYDNKPPADVKQLQAKPGALDLIESRKYNVTRIIPAIRSAVLSGVHILFSSVIPLDTPPQSTEIWRLAYMFGATCHVELVPKVTHVVAAKRGTVKVDTARRQGKTRIVWLAWFTDSVALWRRMDETPYLLDAEENGTKLGAGSNADEVKADVDGDQVSSDHDPDPDDWDDGGLDRGDDVAVDEIDWDDINDEVDAAMNESDDGGEDDDALSDHSASSNGRQGITSEDDGVETKSIVSADAMPRNPRKRMRSSTPGDVATREQLQREGLGSPLSKRKKLVADRTGFSKLKQDVTDHLATSSPNGSQAGSVDGGDEDGDEGDDFDPEDDFLARELGEDWS